MVFLVTLIKGALGSSETSILTRTTWRNIPEDTILRPVYDFYVCGFVSVSLRVAEETDWVFMRTMYCRKCGKMWRYEAVSFVLIRRRAYVFRKMLENLLRRARVNVVTSS
jgi:hypothetical protein